MESELALSPTAANDHETVSEPAELGRLFDLYYRRLYALARRMGRDSEESRDLVQDAFLRAARRPDRVPREDRAAEAWLVRVLVNLCKDGRRRQRVRERFAYDVASETVSRRSPESHSVARATVEAALATLPARRRACLVLRELEGLSVREIAEVMGLQQVTVRWHLAASRRQLARWREQHGLPQVLGRQLHRGQRILDLVRHLTRHFRPRFDLLRLDELGQIFEDHDRTLRAALAVDERSSDETDRTELALLPDRRGFDLVNHFRATARKHRVSGRQESRERRVVRVSRRPVPDERVGVHVEDSHRRFVDGGDPAARIEADHAGRDVPNDRLDVLAPLPVARLRFREPLGHEVERADERADLARRPREDAVSQVARPDPLRAERSAP